MENTNIDQKDSGLRSILTFPSMYHLFQRIVGIDKAFDQYVKEIIMPTSKNKVLDIGCGEGYILNFLPEGIEYVGYDLSSSYIEFAKKRFGNKGTFINQRVSEMKIENSDSLFDIVLATGLLHHLGDEEGKELFKVGFNCLKPGGVMYTYDNAYYTGQSPIARFISSKDRGQHVRFPEQYREIALTAFERIEIIIKNNVIRIPQTICILKCSKV